MELICTEEVRHVQLGVQWYGSPLDGLLTCSRFKYLCEQEDSEPIQKFQQIAKKHVSLVPPVCTS